MRKLISYHLQWCYFLTSATSLHHLSQRGNHSSLGGTYRSKNALLNQLQTSLLKIRCRNQYKFLRQWFVDSKPQYLSLSLPRAGVLKLLVLWSPLRDWPQFTEPHNKFLKIKTKKTNSSRSHGLRTEHFENLWPRVRTQNAMNCNTPIKIMNFYIPKNNDTKEITHGSRCDLCWNMLSYTVKPHRQYSLVSLR